MAASIRSRRRRRNTLIAKALAVSYACPDNGEERKWKFWPLAILAWEHRTSTTGPPSPRLRSACSQLTGPVRCAPSDQGFDLLQGTPEKIVATLGRHSNDLMTSYYMRTPSDIYVECGWGGKDVDDATPPVEMTSVV